MAVENVFPVCDRSCNHLSRSCTKARYFLFEQPLRWSSIQELGRDEEVNFNNTKSSDL